MAARTVTERFADLKGFGEARAAGRSSPFTPAELDHVYIKLDFKPQYENARTSEDAKGFLRSVARAAMAADHLAQRHGGYLLEAQGSTLHVALPRAKSGDEAADSGSGRSFAADLHQAYRLVFDDSRSRVEGWRMAIDSGKTLVVAGRGVHGDDSWVSLGRSANRPAKHLYAQLELPEDQRALKRFHAAIRDPRVGRWRHEDLNRSPACLDEVKSLAEDVRRAEPKLDFAAVGRHVTAQALPIAPSGTPGSPSADAPATYFGWVLRADLDGFTARVDKCFDIDEELQKLAVKFYQIMDDAAAFVDRHATETLAQLPWAGDNFTVAATFGTRAEYDTAVPKRLVELSLDFEKEMAESAAACSLGGWAYGVAGGEVHGNAGGNIYLGAVEVLGRRFLIGAGEGFGKSTQAFGDINPDAGEIVVYQPDWTRLDENYKRIFEPAVTRRSQQSTLYRKARADALTRVRTRAATAALPTVVSLPRGQSRNVATKPYHLA